jgi:hypothetical protein
VVTLLSDEDWEKYKEKMAVAGSAEKAA